RGRKMRIRVAKQPVFGLRPKSNYSIRSEQTPGKGGQIMKRDRFRTVVIKALASATATLVMTAVLTSSAGASRYRILHTFTNAQDGSHPQGNLIQDEAGNLYGTTYGGGYNCGIVFKLGPNPDGTWAYSILY